MLLSRLKVDHFVHRKRKLSSLRGAATNVVVLAIVFNDRGPVGSTVIQSINDGRRG